MEWSEIIPLTEPEARTIVKKYLEDRGYICEEIDPSKLSPGQKSPDLKVLRNGNMAFYCEIKTPEHKLNSETNMYHWDTTYRKLKEFIHKAVKQFNSYDPEHKEVRVIAFTSNHPQLGWDKFMHNLNGAVVYGGTVIRDLSKLAAMDNATQDLLSTDIILWLQVSYTTKEAFLAYHAVNKSSLLIDESEKLSNTFTPIAS